MGKIEIVNAHVHMVQASKAFDAKTKVLMPKISIFKSVKNLLKIVSLLRPKTLFGQMDEAGISKSVLYAVEAPIIYSSNEYVGSLVKKNPDRLIGFAGVNPLEDGAAEKLEKTIKKYGFRGCKLHPPLQNFYPNDKRVFPVYEKLVELGMPVVFHVGTTPFGRLVKLDQANPLLIDEVANRFPKLKIMLTHLGTLWDKEAFMVVEKHPNVYMDTSAFLYEIPKIINQNLIDRIGANKLIFGTDYPTPFGEQQHVMKNFVDCIKALDISEKDKERIFSKNFYDMLNKPAK